MNIAMKLQLRIFLLFSSLLLSQFFVGNRNLFANPVTELLTLDRLHELKFQDNVKCSDFPGIAKDIIATGTDLGVHVKQGMPLIPGKDATYEALHGKLGTIIIRKRNFQMFFTQNLSMIYSTIRKRNDWEGRVRSKRSS